ncbi:MAG: hypothetical protein H0X41_09660, partial [Chitinophagaceae bacterium]|nr:hypothetical protein [Chitinophagaceae bacterium]
MTRLESVPGTMHCHKNRLLRGLSGFFTGVYLREAGFAGILFLCPCLLIAQTTFKVSAGKGYWSVSSHSQYLSHITSQLNGKNILSGAVPSSSGFHTKVDGLDVISQLTVKDNKWVQLAVSVRNHTPDTLYIDSFEPLLVNCAKALKGSETDDLKLMWESATYE